MSNFYRVERPDPSEFADPREPRLRPAHLVAMGLAVLAGVAVYVIGLPSERTFAETPLSSYTLAAAIAVVLLGIAVVGVWAAHHAWRSIEIVTGAVLGVASGVALWLLAISWTPITAPLEFYPPAKALLTGLWLLPGVIGALVLRRPGAALYVELVAATLEGMLPNGWGPSTIVYGVVQGLAIEVVFAVLLYRLWRRSAAMAAGALGGLGAAALDLSLYYPEFSVAHKAAYVVFAALSGALIAGLGAAAITGALARAGALNALPSSADLDRV